MGGRGCASVDLKAFKAAGMTLAVSETFGPPTGDSGRAAGSALT
jgi:hypothetical protein